MLANISADSQSQRHVAFELAGYLMASALALAVDASLFGLALAWGAPLSIAAALGFAAGVILAYFCSTRFIFRARRLHDRSREFGLFVIIGIAGLVLTEALLWLLIDSQHFPAFPAKFLTAGLTFCFNFCLRKALLFNTATLRAAPLQNSRPESLL